MPGIGTLINDLIFLDNVSTAAAPQAVTTVRANAAVVPATPTGTAPIGNIQDATPTFTWSVVANAVSYAVRVDEATAAGTQVASKSGLSVAHWTVPTVLAPGQYIWSVRAFGQHDAASAWSQADAFTVVPLDAPTPDGPSGLIENPAPTFQWQAVANADSYSFSLKDVTTTRPKTVASVQVSATSYTPSRPLTLGHVYQWSVEALSKNGDHSARSSPTTVALISPFTGSYSGQFSGTQTETFAFTISGNGTVAVAQPLKGHGSVDAFGNIVLTITGIGTGAAAASFTGNIDISSGKASLSGGSWTLGKNEHGTWTASASQLDGTPLDTPASQTPTGPIFDTAPHFTWAPVSGAGFYVVQVDDLTKHKSAIRTGTVINATSWTPAVALTVGHTYQWEVRAVKNDGSAGPWSIPKTFVVMPSSNVKVAVTDSAASVEAAGNAGFTITISNKGAVAAAGLTLNDPLPAGAAGDVNWQIDPAAGNPADFGLSGTLGSQTLTLAPTLTSLTAGQSISVHITGVTSFADAPAPALTGSLATKATVSATNEATALQNQFAAAAVTVLAPDVTVSSAADQPSVNAGASAGFTIAVKNAGTATASGVTLSDPLPAGLGNDIVWSIDSSTGNPVDFQINSGVLGVKGISTLTAGQAITVHVTGATSLNDIDSKTLSGTLLNTATVSATNEAAALQNQTGTATVNLLTPDVTVTNSADHTTLNAGSTAGFTVTLTNAGTAGATGITLSDPLPPGLGNDITWSIDSGTGNPADFQISGGTLSLNGISSLAANQSVAVHVTGKITFNDVNPTTFQGTLSSTAQVSAGNEAPALQNQSANATVTVVAPDVTVTNTPDQTMVPATNAAGFTVTISNAGAGTANGVTLSDPLPAGLGNDIVWSIDSKTGNPTDFAVSSGTLSLNGISSLTPEQSITVHVTGMTSTNDVDANTEVGTLSSTATVSASDEATSLQNQSAPSATITVGNPYMGTYTGSYNGYLSATSATSDVYVQGTISFTVSAQGYITTSSPGTGYSVGADGQTQVRLGLDGDLPVYNGGSSGPFASFITDPSSFGGSDSISGVSGGIIGTGTFIVGGVAQTQVFELNGGRNDISIGATFEDIQFGYGVGGQWISTATGGFAPPPIQDPNGSDLVANTWIAHRVSTQP